ncbi:MAG: hypothetical protein QHH00_03225 [Methanomassiliicoccales archaeon]|nr:hypothetical protein [Methanomassiliicoccales archaeon]
MYYCPRCEKGIRKERIDEIDKKLKEMFNLDSLSRKICPVCGCSLIELTPEKGECLASRRSHK